MILTFNFGVDGIIAGLTVSMPKFREDYGSPVEIAPGYSTYVITANWLAAFSAVSQGASILGALISGYIAEKIGRRNTMALSCVIAIGGVSAQYFSNGSLGVLIAGKAIKGVPVGMWIVLGPTYVSEVAPFRVRAVLAAMTNSILFAGVFLFTGVISYVGSRPDKSAYMIPFAVQWVLPGLILLTVIFLPESPVWLCRVGRRNKAIKSLQKIHGSNTATSQDGILAQIEETLRLERELGGAGQESFSYFECFNKTNRHRTITTMFVYTCQYLSGNTLAIGYQSYFYIFTLGWSSEKAFNVNLGATGLYFAANIVAWFMVAKLKRRATIVYGQFGAAACMMIIGACASAATPASNTAAVAFLFIWGIFYETSLATVGWVIGAELPALRLRSRTQGLANVCLQFMGWLQAFVFPYIYNPDAGNLGGKIAFYFGATTLIGAIGCFFLLPETLGRTAAEIDLLYTNNIPIRHFDKADLQSLEHPDEVKETASA